MEGSAFGSYRVETKLGTGGMGTVYRAEVIEDALDLRAGERVALKVIHPHLLTQPGFFKRFLREGEYGKTVQHDNVVRTYDLDAVVLDGRQHNFIVMEYVEGQTLLALLDEFEQVPEELCRHIGREVARGLGAIHAAGLLHRDLKPENVLITSDHDVVKIMDLGVARLASEARRLSEKGAFVGSPYYAAPEQFLGHGQDLDERADLYALGLILYELASGDQPFVSDEMSNVIRLVLFEEPRRLSALNPQLSPFFEEVAHTLLAKNREERFDSASHLLQALESGERSNWWVDRAQEIRAETKRSLRRIRIPRETAVYGREVDLDRLRSLYDKAKSGRGQVVLVEGEAGIGKSRLVDELIDRLRADEEDFDFLFGGYPPGGAATAAGAWATAYGEHFGAEGLEETLKEYLPVTPTLVPAFAALLRGEPPPDGEEPLTKDSIHTVFVHATRALAFGRPTIVLIEDLHFAPEEGRALLAALALAVPDHRILLVGTTRPELPETWGANLGRLEHATRLPLHRLGPTDLSGLLRAAFQSDRLAEELGWRIATKSDGNPFFVFEIIRGLREGRFISRRPDGAWTRSKLIREIEIPSSVKDLIGARISDLDDEEQELLDVASCCGFEFDPHLVAEVVGLAPIRALRLFGHLERSHRLVRGAGDVFVFDHHQVQEALYAMVSIPLRKEYHAAIGRVLAARRPEPDGAMAVDLCDHFLNGAKPEDALGYLDAALDHLEGEYLSDRAARLAERALATSGLLEGPRRVEVLLRLAERMDTLGRREEQGQAVEEALALAVSTTEPRILMKVRWALARYQWALSRYDEAEKEYVKAREYALAAGDRQGEAEIVHGIVNVLRKVGRHREMREHVDELLAISRQIGDRRSEMAATASLGILCALAGRNDEALRQLERYLALAQEIGDRRVEVNATKNLGLLHMRSGLYRNAQEMAVRALALAREIGDRQGESEAVVILGLVADALGRREEARTSYELRLAISREIGDRRSEATALNNLGGVLSELGRTAEAIEHFDRALTMLDQIEYPEGRAVALGNLGLIRAWLGDGEGAETASRAALALVREMEQPLEECEAILQMGVVAECGGDLPTALEWTREALAWGREIDQGELLAEVLVQLGGQQAAAGEEEAAKESLLEARDLATHPGLHEMLTLASARLAVLNGDVAPALAAARKYEELLTHRLKMEVRFLLFNSTRAPVHLEEAYRLFAHLREHAPDCHRLSMVENVPLHREIVAAWEAM